MHVEITRRGLLAGGGALAAASVLPLPFVQPAHAAVAEDGYDLWLRYRLVQPRDLLDSYRRAITHLVRRGAGELLASATAELRSALRGLLGRDVPVKAKPDGRGAVVFGTPDSSPHVARLVGKAELAKLGPEGYVLRSIREGIL